jgi:hypothetical protein
MKKQEINSKLIANRLLSDPSYLNLIKKCLTLLEERDKARKGTEKHLALTFKIGELEEKIKTEYQIPVLYFPRDLKAALEGKETLYQGPNKSIVARLPESLLPESIREEDEGHYDYFKVNKDEPIGLIADRLKLFLKMLDKERKVKRRRKSDISFDEIDIRLKKGISKSQIAKELQSLQDYHTGPEAKRRQVQRSRKSRAKENSSEK